MCDYAESRGFKCGLILVVVIGELLTGTCVAKAVEWDGHVKYQPVVMQFPDNSFYLNYIDSPSIDHNVDTRLNLGLSGNAVTLEASYQLIMKSGDSVRLYDQLAGLEIIAPFYPDDSRRVMNLTHYLIDDGERLLVQRLDRLSLSYALDSAVFKVGRQAISWGNGLMFNPMDFFNPFDPTAVDKEYKTGDDMIYGQYLFDSGNDMQVVAVGRRNVEGELSRDVSSYAAKFHGFMGRQEVDILVSQHYEDTLLALGGIWSPGGTVIRSDIVVTKTPRDNYVSVLANISYAWMSFGKNISAMAEVFYNGFGISDGEYGPDALLQNPDLLLRLSRSESFNLAQQYVAASATIELHPLWLFTPNIFYNINDQSALVQLISSHDVSESAQCLLSVNMPLGPEGSEFGGIDSGQENIYLSSGASVFAQFSWYF